MVDEDALADARGRVDVDVEHRRGEALQIEREIPPPGPQQRMGQAIGLQGVEALEIEHRLDQPHARGIAIGDGHDVGAERLADRRIARDRIVEDLADQRGGDIGVVEPRGDAMGDRAFERLVVEDGGHQERRRAPARVASPLPPRRGCA